ncbi:MAG: hypothetical protein JWO67_6185 [Streptosporangiaceae bacterium]|jgi:hypothetical protein|nr:hypothetical protein [Streptosporangiaceae bacterium]
MSSPSEGGPGPWGPGEGGPAGPGRPPGQWGYGSGFPAGPQPGYPAQPGYPVQPGYQGPPGGFDPPPPRRGRRLPLVAIVIGAVVLLALAGVGVAVAVSGGDAKKNTSAGKKADSTAGQAGKAAQHLATVPALRYNGSFSSGGSAMQAQISVTKAGSASGSVTVDGDKADLVAVDGSTYVKASRSFWRSHGGVTANPEDYADRWSRAPASALDLDVEGVLSPSVLMRQLQTATPQPAGAKADVNGAPAAKVTTSQGDYYVSTAEPHKVLRIQGAGTKPYQFDVTELASAELGSLFTDLRDKVKNLTGAPDPGARFVPVGRLKFSNCGDGGCTVRYTVASVSLGGNPSVRAVMKATINGSGRDLGSCTAGRNVASAKNVDLSCTVKSAGWKSWVRWARSTPGSHRYEAKARVLAEAVSAADVNGLLSKIDQERQGA